MTCQNISVPHVAILSLIWPHYDSPIVGRKITFKKLSSRERLVQFTRTCKPSLLTKSFLTRFLDVERTINTWQANMHVFACFHHRVDDAYTLRRETSIAPCCKIHAYDKLVCLIATIWFKLSMSRSSTYLFLYVVVGNFIICMSKVF